MDGYDVRTRSPSGGTGTSGGGFSACPLLSQFLGVPKWNQSCGGLIALAAFVLKSWCPKRGPPIRLIWDNWILADMMQIAWKRTCLFTLVLLDSAIALRRTCLNCLLGNEISKESQGQLGLASRANVQTYELENHHYWQRQLVNLPLTVASWESPTSFC